MRPAEVAPVRAERSPPERILVTLDGSPLAEAILPDTGALAQALNAELILLRVCRPVTLNGWPAGLRYAHNYDLTGWQRRSWERQLEAHARLALSLREANEQQAADDLAAVASSRLAGLQVQIRTTTSEHVSRAILEQVEMLGADLVAMATHGRSGLSRAVHGSVADKVLRAAPVPVLLVRPRPLVP